MNNQTIGKYRWTICALLFFATTINYMDRQVIGYLKPLFSEPIEKGGLNWSNTDYALVLSLFTGFYALMTFFAGFVIDKIGTKKGLSYSLIIWSVFGILNAFVGSLAIVHAIVRSLFGIGEAGNFPASNKTIAEWFPKKERALAIGIFNSGSNVGAMIASLAVPAIAYAVWFDGAIQGWQMAYIITGAVGLIWLFFWYMLYDTPSRQERLSKAEYDYIHSDDEVVAITEDDEIPTKAPWHRLFAYKQTWAFVLGKFLTDGIWWFLLFWLPDFMKQQFNMEGHEIMVPLFVVYAVAIIGSVSGGSLPMFLMNKGMEAYKARMTAMLIIAVLPLALILTPYFGNVAHFEGRAYIYALIVICIGAAAHQAWSANLFTTVSDMFPKKTVGAVTGIGGLAGGIGGVLVQQFAGRLTDHYKAIGETAATAQNLVGDAAEALVQSHVQTAYAIMFALCASAYLIAWVVMKILVPKHSPITDL
ncbi:ACS family hexuronate transporter-like MFS transporter [Flavobacterium sp. 1]|uniref:MFS transporter n=1 Tax=Flavobacterium sp. 1 TaxID=2035200 RepID=UPI000C249A95|nr:MFS transporter [Flavobacterium sp. 1]PJJ08805.1 ACS family hexuronate transporter-like MFS transporter [Flavobacterium sp. 1]